MLASAFDLLAALPKIDLGTIGLALAALGLAVLIAALFPRRRADTTVTFRPAFLFVLIGATLALRLLFLDRVELIPEEAYYWNYSQYLDIGYLDHPPMVAWLIALGTEWLGHREAGVRIAAILLALATAGFVYAGARARYDRQTAVTTLALFATLPFFFGVSFVMTPDAPLTACWAGALYFFRRALVDQRPTAWLGAGVCLGLGLLSKYTMGLVGLAAGGFVLLDPSARHWLRRWQPYAAAAAAVILFSPVLVWNATHDWASFAFQGARRINQAMRFGLPNLVLYLTALLSPFGIAAAIESLRRLPRWRAASSDQRFVVIFTLLPLAVFGAFSLFHSPRLNWAGPLWLALLPDCARLLTPNAIGSRIGSWLSRAWRPTAAGLVTFYAGLLFIWSHGLPETWHHGVAGGLTGWRELGAAVEAIEHELEARGECVILMGMDRYAIASELAFYDDHEEDDPPDVPDDPYETTGPQLFGKRGLMYEYWQPQVPDGAVVVLLSRDPKALTDRSLAGYFDELEPLHEIELRRHNLILGRYYWRAARRHRSQPSSAASSGECAEPKDRVRSS